MRPFFDVIILKNSPLSFRIRNAKILFNIQAFKDWNWLFVFI